MVLFKWLSLRYLGHSAVQSPNLRLIYTSGLLHHCSTRIISPRFSPLQLHQTGPSRLSGVCCCSRHYFLPLLLGCQPCLVLGFSSSSLLCYFPYSTNGSDVYMGMQVSPNNSSLIVFWIFFILKITSFPVRLALR